MKNDYIFIHEMEASCRIGVTKEERSKRQTLKFSIRIGVPLQQAGRSDNLDDTVDYAEIIKDIHFLLGEREFLLLEHLGEQIARIIFRHALTETAEIKIGKTIFPGIESVGVVIFRSRSQLIR